MNKPLLEKLKTLANELKLGDDESKAIAGILFTICGALCADSVFRLFNLTNQFTLEEMKRSRAFAAQIKASRN